MIYSIYWNPKYGTLYRILIISLLNSLVSGTELEYTSPNMHLTKFRQSSIHSFKSNHTLLKSPISHRIECKYTQAGLDYNGTLSCAGSGWHKYKCLPWSDNNINEESNYCRNINADKKGPWCYLADVWKGYCDIPYCKDCYIPFDDTMRKECKSTRDGLSYNGM